jgi:phage baseplate assembly protein W
MTNIDLPYRFDGRGGTAQPSDQAAQLGNMVRQLLLVSPGERVNRPTFGSGLLNLPFSGNSAELASAVRLSVQADLLRWLGDVIEVLVVSTTSDDATLTVAVSYRVRRTGETGVAVAQKPLPGGAVS